MHRFQICILLACLFIPARLFAAPPVLPGSFIETASAIIYDMDNEAILFEQNADMPIAPASLTKVMSMFLALDYMAAGHARAQSEVNISKEAAGAGGSSMGIRPGENVPLEKLLYGMAVSSGNDASHAVAEYIGGSTAAFVKMMNARARALGMKNTNFANPHGLPHPDQFSTARDMLTLARAYLRAHPDALDMHNTKLLTHAGYTSWNKNPLLGQYPGADGLKTGWVRASGHNLIFTATKNGKRLLGVIMGAPNADIRGAEACRLLDAGFMVCQNLAPTLTAALDALPLDLSRVDARKTGREAGLLKPKITNRRLAGTKKLLKQGRKTRFAKNTPKKVKGAPVKTAKKAVKRKTHAFKKSANPRRS